ncbi:hypothetical protein K456DRAFT_1802134, partial [Colletotrichum gloeosporioides 23]
SENRWIINERGLDWVKYFDQHIKLRVSGKYYLLILIINSHKSYLSAKFNNYYKQNNIITVSMPAYSLYLLQLLDITLYSPLKHIYSNEINLFIRASINHITKSNFFITF